MVQNETEDRRWELISRLIQVVVACGLFLAAAIYSEPYLVPVGVLLLLRVMFLQQTKRKQEQARQREVHRGQRKRRT